MTFTQPRSPGRYACESRFRDDALEPRAADGFKQGVAVVEHVGCAPRRPIQVEFFEPAAAFDKGRRVVLSPSTASRSKTKSVTATRSDRASSAR